MLTIVSLSTEASMIRTENPITRSTQEPLITIPCWLVHARGLNWARWWCAEHRHWHSHGWRDNDDGRRRAPCIGQLQLVSVGRATAELLKSIRDGDAPPGSNDPGQVVDPLSRRADLLLELR